MKYDYTEDFMKALLQNISRLLLLPQYRFDADYQTAKLLYKTMNPKSFQKPTTAELQGYLKLIDTLRPVSAEGKKAVRYAQDDLYYLTQLKG